MSGVQSLRSLYTNPNAPSSPPPTAAAAPSRNPTIVEDEDDSGIGYEYEDADVDADASEIMDRRSRHPLDDDSASPVATNSSYGGLRKSVSITDALAGQIKANGLIIDRAVRGISDEPVDYVDDYILETLDYDSAEDTANELALERSGALHTHYLLLLKVLMMILIGFVTAMLMYIVSTCVSNIFSSKISVTTNLISSGNYAGAFFAFLFMNLAITLVAAASVSILAPHARGGGVPYAISYLNGTNVADYFSLRVVLVKTFALIFTISGGLTLGMEGPFVFIGGGVALFCSSAIDRIFPWLMLRQSMGFSKVMRNIREERIFMAGGLAAGLAVAFDAPIAGVLFAMEGSTAFLTVPTVLRIFGCAMFASFFNDLGHTNFGNTIINHNLITVTMNSTLPQYIFSLVEIIPFTIIGLIGGVAGAGATFLNIQMSRWRHHHLEGHTWKDIGKQIGEVALFSCATSIIWFILPFIFGCRTIDLNTTQCYQDLSDELSVKCRTFQCTDGISYSEIGTIVFSTSDQIGRLLFDRTLLIENEFHIAPLICYGIAYWLLVSLLYGAYVPGGLFVPSIVVGGVYGRVVGIILITLFPNSNINPGVYALLGASSMLGGFTRLALPIVLMLIELTGDATYLLPIMYCGVIGKFTADYLYGPLYPQHMALEKIPTLTDQINPLIAKLSAHQVMLSIEKCATMYECERLSVVKNHLMQSKRVVFPLISPQRGQLCGLISRRAILYAVHHAQSYATMEEAAMFASQRRDVEPDSTAELLDWHSSTMTYQNNLTISSFQASEDQYINLHAYADCGVIMAHPSTPTKRMASLFRRLGLAHLAVVDTDNRFLGLITRRCLIVPPNPNAITISQIHAAAAAAVDENAATIRDVTLNAQEELQQILRQKQSEEDNEDDESENDEDDEKDYEQHDEKEYDDQHDEHKDEQSPIQPKSD